MCSHNDAIIFCHIGRFYDMLGISGRQPFSMTVTRAFSLLSSLAQSCENCTATWIQLR